MRRVVDNAARHKSNSQVEQDDRYHPSAKGTLETLRQLVAILYSENKQHPDQTEEGARCSRRRTVTGLDQKTSDQAGMRTGNHCQVTRQHAGNSSSDPKRY